MICKISDLVVEVPASGGMAPRCEKYLTDQTLLADIIVREELYKPERHPDWRYDQLAYMMSGAQFYRQLLKFDGMLLHASAVAVDGRAYLFSGPSGMGKSTHTRLWQELLGEDAKVFNDDKPALRCLDGVWYAYGTPWCGKDGINLNLKVPLAGICFLKRGEQNAIRTLNSKEASFELISPNCVVPVDGNYFVTIIKSACKLYANCVISVFNKVGYVKFVCNVHIIGTGNMLTVKLYVAKGIEPFKS